MARPRSSDSAVLADTDVDLVLAPFIYRRVTSQALIELGYIAPVVDRVLVAFGRVPA